jgi:predicted nucleic acid-binding protein
MKFWDSSAIVPLLVGEAGTRAAQALAREDSSIVVWWGASVECASAIARLERDGALDESGATEALARLSRIAGAWHEIDATDPLRETAVRCLRVHPLRAADALQLAAALVAAQGRPSTLTIVTRDDRLASSARREGFVVTGLDA